MHRPRLVILDEPTAGVDFELRTELWSYIRRLHAEGTTILLTTHYLEEAEALCEEIALIRDGRLIARDTADGPARALRRDSLADVYVKAMDGGERPREPGGETARRAMPAGLRWLAARSLRVSKLWTQTVLAPVVSLAPVHPRLRALAGRPDQAGRAASTTRSSSCPGLIAMAMVQAAYANNASTIFQARSDRYINDVLSAPMHPWQMNLGYMVGGVVRALRDRRRAARRSRSRSPACRVAQPLVLAAGRRCWRWCCFARARDGRRHLRRELGPHDVHLEHRDPAAGLPRRRLLLGGHALPRRGRSCPTSTRSSTS